MVQERRDMKAITIHGIDEELSKLIKAEAESQGLSLNRTIKQLLRTSLGLTDSKKEKRRQELMKFFGKWSKEDAEEFDRNIEKMGFEEIDEEDWK